MGIYYCKATRRQFLIGSGRALLALPMLPSLLPRQAWGQTTGAPRRLMFFDFDHNNLNTIWPSPSVATNSIGDEGGREVLFRQLGAVSSHSPALSHPLYESIKNNNLLTMVRGLDTRHSSGHGTGAWHAGEGRESTIYPTLGEILEVCPSVYPANTPITVRRALRVALRNYPFRRKVGGNLEDVTNIYRNNNLQTFYNDTFSHLTGGTTPPRDLTNDLKTNILNRVFSSFQTFRNGGRISSDDRARLDAHMDYLSDIQRSLASITPPPGPNCSRPSAPTGITSADDIQLLQTYLQLLAVAFRCGITKVGTLAFEGHNPDWIPNMSSINPSGHGIHGIVHGSHGGDLQAAVKTRLWQYYCDEIAQHFLTPLQELEGNTGRSYLENMLVVYGCGGGWAQPGTDGGHGGNDTQQIILGSMGGRMRSGHYVNTHRRYPGEDRNSAWISPNTPYNRFLITLTQLMGAQPNEYAFATNNGLGLGHYDGFFSGGYAFQDRFYSPLVELTG